MNWKCLSCPELLKFFRSLAEIHLSIWVLKKSFVEVKFLKISHWTATAPIFKYRATRLFWLESNKKIALEICSFISPNRSYIRSWNKSPLCTPVPQNVPPATVTKHTWICRWVRDFVIAYCCSVGHNYMNAKYEIKMNCFQCLLSSIHALWKGWQR